jgi:hypothetical protein
MPLPTCGTTGSASERKCVQLKTVLVDSDSEDYGYDVLDPDVLVNHLTTICATAIRVGASPTKETLLQHCSNTVLHMHRCNTCTTKSVTYFVLPSF